MLRILLRALREAGAPDETTHPRTGLLSHSAETHALALGIAAGYLQTAADDRRLLDAVVMATLLSTEVLPDVARERAYALAGVVLGHALGRLLE